jgi:recombination protein RecA
LASAACPAAASSRSTAGVLGQNHHLPSRSSPKPRRPGGVAAFVDVEHALDPVYARKLGVDIDNLLVSQPDFAEQALEIADTLIQLRLHRRSSSSTPSPPSSPKPELDGQMGDSTVGVHARLHEPGHAQAQPPSVAKSNALPASSSTRSARRSASCSAARRPPPAAAPSSSSRAVRRRHPPHRLSSRRRPTEVIGNRTKVKVVKNKVAPPFREAEFDIIYGQGVSREGDLIDLAVANTVVEKSGSWYSYEGDRIGQGRDSARQFIKDDPDFFRRIDVELRDKLGLAQAQVNPDLEEAAVATKK